MPTRTKMSSPCSDSTLGRGRGLIEIDGARGEGGGQVLRTALALALFGRRELRISNIRAGRSRPGLLRQHLSALRAAACIGNAELEGGELHASSVRFAPRSIEHGDHRFSVGTAGSAILVLQTILMPLLLTPGSSRLRLEGGTHNPSAPTYDYLERVFIPLLRRMGAKIECRILRAGFFPAGGGIIEVELEGGARLEALGLLERGELLETHARAMSAHLPAHITQRELKLVGKKLGWTQLERVSPESIGPGNVLSLEVRSEQVSEAFVAFGTRGVAAEEVARRAIRQARAYLDSPWPVGEHLADQLMLPMAIVGGSFRTRKLSPHAETNLALLREFLGVGCEIEELVVQGQVGLELRLKPS